MSELEQTFKRVGQLEQNEGELQQFALTQARRIIREARIVDAEPLLGDVDNYKSLPAVGNVLVALRQKTGESLRTVGVRAKVSPTHLSHIESLQSSPTEQVIRKLAKAYGVHPAVLFGGSPPTKSTS